MGIQAKDKVYEIEDLARGECYVYCNRRYQWLLFKWRALLWWWRAHPFHRHAIRDRNDPRDSRQHHFDRKPRYGW